MKKKICAIVFVTLLAGTKALAADTTPDGWQEGSSTEQKTENSSTVGESGEIGLLGYIGNVTQGNRDIDIDGDGKTDYRVAQEDFVSVSVTLESYAVATMKADSTVDFRCGTIAVVNENEKKPVKVQIQNVDMSGAADLKLVEWNDIGGNNSSTGTEIALKVLPVRKNDFAETDASVIGKTGEASYLTITESLTGAIGYKLDGNYTEKLLTDNEGKPLPKISFVYKISGVS